VVVDQFGVDLFGSIREVYVSVKGLVRYFFAEDAETTVASASN
jgi:hypothetical protein